MPMRLGNIKTDSKVHSDVGLLKSLLFANDKTKAFFLNRKMKYYNLYYAINIKGV